MEIDLRTSRDWMLFLFHDRLIRPENCNAPDEMYGKPFESFNSADLSKVRYGAGREGILEFSRALDLIRGTPVAFQLDLKTGPGRLSSTLAAVLAVVEQKQQQNQVIVQCQDLDQLRYIRRSYPQIEVLARVRSPAEFREALKEAPLIVQGDRAWLTEELIALAKQGGSRVLLKAFSPDADDVQSWCLALCLGADIVLTDHPHAFIDFVPKNRSTPCSVCRRENAE